MDALWLFLLLSVTINVVLVCLLVFKPRFTPPQSTKTVNDVRAFEQLNELIKKIDRESYFNFMQGVLGTLKSLNAGTPIVAFPDKLHSEHQVALFSTVEINKKELNQIDFLELTKDLVSDANQIEENIFHCADTTKLGQAFGLNTLVDDSDDYLLFLNKDHYSCALFYIFKSKNLDISYLQTLGSMLNKIMLLGIKINHYKQTLKRTTLRAKLSLQSLAEEKSSMETRLKTDELTGLANRNQMSVQVNDELNRALRYGNTFSIILADIDDLTELNHLHGYEEGDKLIKHFAKIIAKLLRDTDSLSRWSGDQFLLLLPETHHFGAIQFAERIRHQCERHPLSSGKETINGTLTLAAATFDKKDENIVQLAEETLKKAKVEQRNKVVSCQSYI